MVRLTFLVNGEECVVTVSASSTLCDVLRDELGFTEVKKGCGGGECGACTVLVDGKAANSCLMLASKADGKQIVTVKGLSSAGNCTLCRRNLSSMEPFNAVIAPRA